MLRNYRPADSSRIAERHGALFHPEFGWDLILAAPVSGFRVDMKRRFATARERDWIAARGDERPGCLALLRHREREGVARLRILRVEPAARGLGLGERLVAACTAFARARPGATPFRSGLSPPSLPPAASTSAPGTSLSRQNRNMSLGKT